MPKVSVIIPVYGVEKYIERCARSLFEQTLDDIEFIFVDDCTKDNSIAVLQHVLDVYPNRKAQTKIVHHEVNKGLPSARRTGIEIAKGEYIAHCDSDDWVDVTMYEKMYEKAESERSDIVVCDYYTASDKGRFHSKGCKHTNIHAFVNDLLFTHISWAVWNKMVKRVTYTKNQIMYPVYSMGEDMTLTIQLACCCKSVSYVSQPLYNYFYNNNSITKHKTRDSLIEQYQQALSNWYLLKDAVHILKMQSKRFDAGLLHIRFSQKSILLPLLIDDEGYKLWSEGIFCKDMFCTPFVPMKDRVFYLLIKTRIIPYLFTV